jgi:hypothetical protein
MDSEAIGRQYDQIADHWQEPHLQSNGLAQFEKAIRFTKNRGPALDIGCGSSGRFIDLLSKHGFAPEGLDAPGEKSDSSMGVELSYSALGIPKLSNC